MGTSCCGARDGPPKKKTVAQTAKSQEAVSRMTAKTLEIEKFVMDTIQSGKKWTDPAFPPKINSLYDPKIDNPRDLAKYKSFKWKRFHEIYKKPVMFKDGIDPNDIN